MYRAKTLINFHFSNAILSFFGTYQDPDLDAYLPSRKVGSGSEIT